MQILFGVEGMSCGGCKSKIMNHFETVSEVSECNVDLEKKEVLFSLSSTDLKPMAIKTMVEGLGFKVTKMEKK